MLKKLLLCWLVLVGLSFGIENGAADGFGAWGFFVTGNVVRPASSIPTIVPGTNLALIPRSQTTVDPSTSQDGPRCLDSTWGACDGTQHCIAPTSGTPLESCQAPLQLTTGTATGNGTVATLHYTSVANFAYAVTQPLIISGATQANWNTPQIQLNTHWVVANSDALCPSSGPSMEIGFFGAPLAAAPFTVGQSVYFAGLSGSGGSGFGWGQSVINATQPNGRHTVVAVTTSTAKFCMTLEPMGVPTITARGSATLPASLTTFTNVPTTATSGTGSGLLLTVTAGCGGCGFGGGVINSNFAVTDWGNQQYQVGDTFTIQAGAVGNLTGFIGTIATVSALGTNADGFSGNAVAPWAVSTSSCAATACTVIFANPYSCASSCVSPTTQIVAGQFDDDILAWHYGENVPMKTFASGQNVLICTAPAHISPQQAVWFEADGGAFVKAATPIADPWGIGGPWPVAGVGTVTMPMSAAQRIYCAQAPASSFTGDGQHEIRAIACATVGYCTQLTSVQAIDGSAASPYFTAHSHGKKDWSYQGITKSFDVNFPNYDWATQTAADVLPDGQPIILGSVTTNGSTMVVPWSIAAPLIPTKANQYISITGLTATNNICTVIGGTATLPYATLTVQGTCSYPTGSKINVANVSNTGGVAWNGTGIIVTTGTSGSCSTSCTVTYPALDTGVWSSGGTVTPNLNGICHVISATASTVTCPQLAAAGVAASSTGCSFPGPCMTNLGSRMCVVGGNGDNPPPYTQFDTTQIPFGSQMNPDQFQLIPRLPAIQTCTSIQTATGCQHDLITHTVPCGLVPSATETLWSWDLNSGRQQGDGGVVKLMMGSYFFYTNVGGTIQSSRAYVDSWNPSSIATGSCRNTNTFAAGSSLSDAPSIWAGATCNNITLAASSLVPNVGFITAGTLQTTAQLTVGSTQCTVFENGNNVGTVPFFKGGAVDTMVIYDTNSGTDSNTGLAMPEFASWSQYWVVGVGLTDTGNANGITLALRPGGPCINENPALIANTTAGTNARLMGDASFDEILFRCNTTLAVPCSATHPETVTNGNTAATDPSISAQAGYINLDPDLAFAGTNVNTVSLIPGLASTMFGGNPEQGGRIRQGVSSIDSLIDIPTAVATGPTPPQVTVTSGSLASCPAGPGSGHQCETLNFTAVKDNLGQANGATFQAPSAGGSPGQSIWVRAFTSTTWNCGSSISAPCLGNNGTIAGIVSSTSTSVTFVNDAATGSVTGTGTITGVNLVVEAAAGTFAPACTNADGSVINTSGFTFCYAGVQTTGAVLGTNQYSQPVQGSPFGTNGNIGATPSIINNASCLTTPSGMFTYPTLLNHVVPAAVGGTTNDLIYLTSQLTTQNATGATYAMNQCDSTLHLANNSFTWPGGYTDMWQDSIQISGPYWRGSRVNPAGSIGAWYTTNTLFYKQNSTMDGTSYAWGSEALYTSGCINSSETVITDYCVSGQQRVPVALGGTMNPDGTFWLWITKGWASDGTPTLCGGVDCLADAAHADSGKATVTLGVAPGAITPDYSTNWNLFVACNFTSAALAGQETGLGSGIFGGAFNNKVTATSPSNATITLTTPISGSCVIPSSSPVAGNPMIYMQDANHVDYNFQHYNGDANPPTTVQTGGASNWMHFKDYVVHNIICLCGTQEQLLTQGGNFVNIAHEEEQPMGLDNPGAGFLGTVHAIDLNGGTILQNYILRNDTYNMNGRTSPTPNQTIDGLYFININGGINPRFPLQSISALNQGFLFATANAVISFAGSSLYGGYNADAAIVPTGARYVDPATGLPTGPAQDPIFNSFLAEPWYGPGSSTGDTGLGSW